jgi:hypothetical protein
MNLGLVTRGMKREHDVEVIAKAELIISSKDEFKKLTLWSAVSSLSEEPPGLATHNLDSSSCIFCN